MNPTKLKVISRLNPEYLKKYIIERFSKKIIKTKLTFGDDFGCLVEELNFDKDGGAEYIIFEDFNLPYFNYRVYYQDDNMQSYKQIVEDYFGNENIVRADLGCIYDVKKDKFIKVSYEIKENIKEI